MSVQKKVLLIGSLIILMSSGAFFVKGLAQYSEEINLRTKINEDQREQVLSDVQEYLLEGYKTRITGFIELDPELKAAFIARDLEKAKKIASLKYQILKGENSYFNLLQFHLPDGNIFFRVKGQPESAVGKRPMIEEARKTKKTIAGFEIGREGCLYRIVYPIFDKGLYAGAVEFGIKAKQVINPLKDKLKSEVAVYFLSSEWEKAVNHPKGPLIHFGEYTLVTHNDKIYKLIEDQITSINLGFDHAAFHGEISYDGKSYIAHLNPDIKNFQGDMFGGFMILQDITPIIERKKEFIRYSLLLTALILTVSLTLLYATTKKLVGKLEDAEKDLFEMSIKDDLTGLYNRRYLSQEILIHAHNCMCRHDSNYVCLMIDLDDFKQINDEYGHLYGDLVLREFSKLLEFNVRDIDVVSRYGGEEFVVILNDSSLKHGILTATRIRQAAEKHIYEKDGIAINVTVSIGIASFSDHISDHQGKEVYLLLDYADKALYAAKKSGKNCIKVYENSEESFT